MPAPGRAKRVLKVGLVVLAAGLVAIQFVPYGRAHANPPVVKEPPWDVSGTRELAVRACFDCHSNETRWPWYSHVAPLSWLVQSHVEDGRKSLNFSEWQRTYKDADEASEAVTEGYMPLDSYVVAHPRARLSPDEKERLAQGLEKTVGGKRSEPNH